MLARGLHRGACFLPASLGAHAGSVRHGQRKRTPRPARLLDGVAWATTKAQSHYSWGRSLGSQRRRHGRAPCRHAVTLSLRTIVFMACVGVFALTLCGCGEIDPPYSSLVKYALRSDPLVLTEKLGDERFDPDRPGQLPLSSIKDLIN